MKHGKRRNERKLSDITHIHIERANCVSKKKNANSETSSNKLKTVIVKLSCYKDKEKRLKPDFSRETQYVQEYRKPDFSRETQHVQEYRKE